jgi:hypothetical protein
MKLLILLLLLLNHNYIYANSSWRWFAGNPITLLPLVVFFTLFSEIILIIKINKINNIQKTALVIVLANLASFLFPYLYMGLFDELRHDYGFMKTLEYNINAFPVYIINIGYLFITMAIETPIVYNLLKGMVGNKKKLITSTIILNIITTSVAAIIEHIKYNGSW